MRVQGSDAGAAIRQQVNQAFGGEDLQRFAQRGAGNPQHFTELPLRNAPAVRDISLDDIVAELSQDLVMQRNVVARAGIWSRAGGEGGCVVWNQGAHDASTLKVRGAVVDRKIECKIILISNSNGCNFSGSSS